MKQNSRSMSFRSLLLLFCIFVEAAFLRAQTLDADESQIRAMIIVNLTKFIDWPASRSDHRSPFVVCATGNEPVGAALETLLSGKTVQGRPVLVRRSVVPEQAEACHILYVSNTRHIQAGVLAGSLPTASVLTVSDEHQGRSGTVIGLPLVDGHIGIEINRTLAQHTALVFSSHLLQIASEGR